MELWDFGGPCLLEALDASVAGASIHAFFEYSKRAAQGFCQACLRFWGSIRVLGCSWTRCVKSMGGLDSGVKGPT